MKRSTKLRVRFSTYLLCLHSFCVGQLAQSVPETTTAVINVKVDTAYDDSERSLTLLQAIAEYAPFRQIPIVQGDTLDKVFVREYGFGQTDLPKSYALLIRVILARNHLARPEDLKPGTLIIPAVPKRAWLRWGRGNVMNYVANMSIFRSEMAKSASAATNRKPSQIGSGITEREPSELAYSETVAPDPHRLTAPTELLQFGMPLNVARKLLESTAFEKGTVTASTYPLPVKLASDNACDTEDASRDHHSLTPDQKHAISLLLQQQSIRSPVLFILDTGWPSYDSYKESRAALYDVLDTVWQHEFGTPFAKPNVQRTIANALNEHCRCIERALKELRPLDNADPHKKVRIIYVPLTREQGASTILTDLLETSSLLLRSQADRVGLNTSIIRGARARANELVMRHFPSQWSGEEVNTDKSVLDAVLLIGQAYAPIAKSVFFVNESWTVTHEAYGGKYYVQYQNPQYGLVVSATGNDGTTKLLDFAQRSTSAKDTMAIMNMNSGGVLAPLSTRVPASYIDIVDGAGFDGAVTDDISGTSFAAPRIAWFLAAGEAVRKKQLTLDTWGTDLSQELQALRDPQATGYKKLLFDPVRYIGAQAQVENNPRNANP